MTSLLRAEGKDGVCDFGSRRCKEGDACVGFRSPGSGEAVSGRCMRASARYVPAHSTHFGCKVGTSLPAWEHILTLEAREDKVDGKAG